MTKNEIVAALGQDRRVEEIILRIAGESTLSADLKDLAQMLYLTLLEYDDDKLEDLWENGQINFLIVRLVLRNLRSNTSRYYYTIRRFRLLSFPLNDLDRADDEG